MVGAEDVDELLVVAAVEGAGVLLVVGSGVVLEVVGAAVEEEVGVIAVLGVVLEVKCHEISKHVSKLICNNQSREPERDGGDNTWCYAPTTWMRSSPTRSC